jgi:hypothetical protein
MAERIEHITGDGDRIAAIEWIEWCESYAAERDPFARPIQRARHGVIVLPLRPALAP